MSPWNDGRFWTFMLTLGFVAVAAALAIVFGGVIAWWVILATAAVVTLVMTVFCALVLMSG